MQLILIFSFISLANLLFLQEASDQHLRSSELDEYPTNHEVRIEEFATKQ